MLFNFFMLLQNLFVLSFISLNHLSILFLLPKLFQAYPMPIYAMAPVHNYDWFSYESNTFTFSNVSSKATSLLTILNGLKRYENL
jgi:hypothetical protein